MCFLCYMPWIYMWVYPYICGNGIGFKARNFKDVSDMVWCGMKCCPCIPLWMTWMKCEKIESPKENQDKPQAVTIVENNAGPQDTFYNERRNSHQMSSPMMTMQNAPPGTGNGNGPTNFGAGSGLPMVETETLSKGDTDKGVEGEINPEKGEYMAVMDNSQLEEKQGKE